MRDAKQKKMVGFHLAKRLEKAKLSSQEVDQWLPGAWGGNGVNLTANWLEEFFKNILPIMHSAFSVTSSVYWLKRAQPYTRINP